MQDQPNEPQRAGDNSKGKDRHDHIAHKGPCECYVKLYWVPVGGTSVTDLLDFIANLLIDNPGGKTIYHSALRVQFEEGGECKQYVIELTETAESPPERRRVGETVEHNIFGPFDYTIRLFRNGQIEDEAHATQPIELTTDCGIASNIAKLVEAEDVPDLGYGDKVGTRSGATDRWTSNSVVSWLLQRTGLNPGGIFPPSGGIAPGWDAGSTYAWEHFP